MEIELKKALTVLSCVVHVSKLHDRGKAPINEIEQWLKAYGIEFNSRVNLVEYLQDVIVRNSFGMGLNFKRVEGCEPDDPNNCIELMVDSCPQPRYTVLQ